MRRDFLEIDTSIQSCPLLRPIELADVEAIRLLLTGGSVIDWQRLAFRTVDQVDAFLALQLIDVHNPDDRARLRYVYNESVSYLEEHLRLRFPSELRDPEDVRQVFLWASQFGGFRRTQILSCVVLKLMHVIHHMEAADLKFRTAMSEEYYSDQAYGRILECAREMQQSGLPILSFYGNKKSRSSVITKLLAKKEATAATVFDKLRFRIVVSEPSDIIPVLAELCRRLFPWNYVIPAQSHNNLLDPATLMHVLPADAAEQAQKLPEEPEIDETGKNEFSGRTYRMVNFIVDFPVRIPESVPGTFSFELGRLVFVLVEFQILDEETAAHNEEGENAHYRYKRRQQQVVSGRLKRGRREG